MMANESQKESMLLVVPNARAYTKCVISPKQTFASVNIMSTKDDATALGCWLATVDISVREFHENITANGKS